MESLFATYLPWFILREVPHIGNCLYARLIRHFGSAARVLAATRRELVQVDGIGQQTAGWITRHDRYRGAAEKELEQVLKNGYRILTLGDPAYPPLLAQIPDPPPVLTYVGSLDIGAPCISIIGSRHATRYGLDTARNLSARLARKGFQVISGMARGIDSAAHTGALQAKQRTVAVLGSGLNAIYPRENRPLFNEIARTGTVYSEFKVDTEPVPANFPVRNRIIAGMSCGTLVVEAAKKSGSLITARLAGEYNREVFAVPGSITSTRSQGTHLLLKQGAKLVENEIDIIDELGHFIHAEKQPLKNKPEQTDTFPAGRTAGIRKGLLDFIEPYPVHIDLLIQKSRLDSSRVASQLTELELSGRIHRHPGNYYSISEERN